MADESQERTNSTRSIMDMLDELDGLWRRGQRPDLRQLLARLKYDGDTDLCIELCAADLEWRWRAMADKSDRSRRAANAWALSVSLADSPAGPHASEYAPLLEGLWLDPSCQARMIEAEWLARSQWGDRPDLLHFLEAYPHLIEIKDELAEQLNQLAQLTMAVSKDDKPLLSLYLPARFVIGRQNRGEPAPPVWLPNQARMIVSSSDDRSLSREQMTVRRTRTHEIEIANSSRNVAISLENGTLSPGNSTRVPTPVAISLAGLCLRIETSQE